MTIGMAARTAHPYEDTDVIDARAPRTNQAIGGSLALIAFLTGAAWLPGCHYGLRGRTLSTSVAPENENPGDVPPLNE
jgi:hypothetical protein